MLILESLELLDDKRVGMDPPSTIIVRIAAYSCETNFSAVKGAEEIRGPLSADKSDPGRPALARKPEIELEKPSFMNKPDYNDMEDNWTAWF